MQERADVVVVGGGLAGLGAAAFAARGGAAVTVLERSGQAGGRARTRAQDGFLFNVGAHALYRAGHAKTALDALGVRVEGRIPPARGLALRDGAAYPLPAGFGTLLGSRLFSLRSKLRVGRLLAGLTSGRLRPPRGASMDEWGRALGLRADAAGFLAALARVTTYTDDPGRLDAAALADQVHLALRAGVLYLDGGWQTIVDGLAGAAVDAGARIEAGTRAEAVETEGGRVSGVRTADGRRLPAQAVVLAVPPAEAARIGGAASLQRAAAEAVPVRAAALDLGLRRLPRPHTFALGFDRPWYFSVHSATARLAPGGGALVHALRYLGGAYPTAAEAERDLEELMDRVQPGWREEVQVRRLVPELLVAHDLPRADRGGLAGRTPVAVPELGGLFLAGDWVGSEGLLADASLASARRAAELALAERRRGQPAGHAA